MAVNFSGFSSGSAVAEAAAVAAIAKLEGKVGRAMNQAPMDFTLVNTDLWERYPRTAPACSCERETDYPCFGGPDGIEIHVSESSLDTAALVRTMYHALSHSVLYHTDRPEWRNSPRNGRPARDTLIVDGVSYPVQEVVVNAAR